jgi:hypothetical protein
MLECWIGWMHVLPTNEQSSRVPCLDMSPLLTPTDKQERPAGQMDEQECARMRAYLTDKRLAPGQIKRT